MPDTSYPPRTDGRVPVKDIKASFLADLFPPRSPFWQRIRRRYLLSIGDELLRLGEAHVEMSLKESLLE